MAKSVLIRHAAAVAIALILGLCGLLAFLTLRNVSTSEGFAFTTDVLGTAAPVSWIAYQDGDQPWQTVRVEGHRYRLPNRSGRFGLALVCEQEYLVRIIQGTTRELSAFQVSFTGGVEEPLSGYATYALACRPGTSSAKYPIYIRETGMRPDHGAYVAQFSSGNSSGPLKVPAGTRDIVVMEVPKRWMYGEGELPARIVLIRAVVVDGEKHIDVDFSRDGFAPLTRTMTLRGLRPGEVGWFSAAFFTPLGTEVPLGQLYPYQKLSVFRFGAIPPEHRRRGDLHRIKVEVSDKDAGTRCVARDALAPEDLVVDLPPPLASAAAKVVARQPYYRLRATWSSYPGVQVYRVTYAYLGPCDDCPSLQWEVLLTTGWLAGASSYTLPDFSTLAGWNRDWGLELQPIPPGSPGQEAIHWRVEAVSSNAGPSGIIGPAAGDAPLHPRRWQVRPVADGNEVRCAGREGDEGWGVGP